MILGFIILLCHSHFILSYSKLASSILALLFLQIFFHCSSFNLFLGHPLSLSPPYFLIFKMYNIHSIINPITKKLKIVIYFVMYELHVNS